MLGALKIIPMLLALCEATNTLFDLLDVYIPAFSLLGGTSQRRCVSGQPLKCIERKVLLKDP